MTAAGAADRVFRRLLPGGAAGGTIERPVPLEVPVSIEFAGIGYAVLMATPVDLDDLVLGFAWSERIVDDRAQLGSVEAHPAHRGVILRAGLVTGRLGRLADRVRHRTSDSACGLCGIESLEQAIRPLPRVPPGAAIGEAALFAAAAALRHRQPLNRATGATHAAAWCDAEGGVLTVREDVGRHNAMDKLVGALIAEGRDRSAGFALLSSRCSYELVEKAALAGIATLVTVSAPTAMALDRAAEAGVRLVALARADAMLDAVLPPDADAG